MRKMLKKLPILILIFLSFFTSVKNVHADGTLNIGGVNGLGGTDATVPSSADQGSVSVGGAPTSVNGFTVPTNPTGVLHGSTDANGNIDPNSITAPQAGDYSVQSGVTNTAIPTNDNTTYQLLAPLVEYGSGGLIQVPSVSTAPGSFATYVNLLYRIAILIAGVLAVVMITIGGMEYMASDSPFSKGDGKTKITNALIGLLLLVSSYLILNTINPQLLNLNIAIGSSGGTASTNAIPTSDLGNNTLNVNSGSQGSTGSTNFTDTSVTSPYQGQTLNLYSGAGNPAPTTNNNVTAPYQSQNLNF